MPKPAKHPVLGVNISTTNYDEVCSRCTKLVDERRRFRNSGQSFEGPPPVGRYICVTSVHGIMTAVRDSSFRRILNGADVATPDGMPVVWALRSFGNKEQSRVYGPDLMLAICHQAARLGQRVFLYGGHEEAVCLLCERLRQQWPGIAIVGAFSPPFRPLSPEEDAEVVRRILSADADIVFVGISTPKQEKWMRDHVDKLPGVIMVGVGAAFDFHAGRVAQAPLWMRRAGLEWLFRLMAEPRRLWRRYLLVTPLFLPLWILQRMGVLRYAAPEPNE